MELLKKRPRSFKDFKVSLYHLEIYVPLQSRARARRRRKDFEWFLVAIYNSFGAEFESKSQVLLSNLYYDNYFTKWLFILYDKQQIELRIIIVHHN